MSPPSNPPGNHVGWIFTAQTEYAVACEFLDEEYSTLATSPLHDKTYTFGRIRYHNVLIA
jgi:hypothetical protein